MREFRNVPQTAYVLLEISRLHHRRRLLRLLGDCSCYICSVEAASLDASLPQDGTRIHHPEYLLGEHALKPDV